MKEKDRKEDVCALFCVLVKEKDRKEDVRVFLCAYVCVFVRVRMCCVREHTCRLLITSHFTSPVKHN